MAPINLPDGSEVSEVILPDGASASEVIAPDGSAVFSAIPDESIYLQDDWGDNKLQNRDGSGTTTYNGVTGYYRPEWTIPNGSPSASNQTLSFADGDTLYCDFNLDLDETIRWTWTNIHDLTTDDTTQAILAPLATTRTISNGFVLESYNLGINTTDARLWAIDANGSTNKIIGNPSTPPTPFDMSLERSPSGDWTLFFNGSSVGSGYNTTYTNVQNFVFNGRGGGMDVEEMEVE
jgi:hypothetical protein